MFPWFGWLLTVLAFLFGLWMLVKFSRKGALTPITLRKIERFKSIKRGYYSFLILIGLAGMAALDHALVGVGGAGGAITTGKLELPGVFADDREGRRLTAWRGTPRCRRRTTGS